MYICVWGYACMWICASYDVPVKVRGQPPVLILTVHLVWDGISCLLLCILGELAHDFWDSPVSISHLAIEVLGFQMFTSLLGCVWVLKIQAQVLRLDKHFTSWASEQVQCFIFFYEFTLKAEQKCLDSRPKGMALRILTSCRRNHTFCLFLNLFMTSIDKQETGLFLEVATFKPIIWICLRKTFRKFQYFVFSFPI